MNRHGIKAVSMKNLGAVGILALIGLSTQSWAEEQGAQAVTQKSDIPSLTYKIGDRPSKLFNDGPALLKWAETVAADANGLTERYTITNKAMLRSLDGLQSLPELLNRDVEALRRRHARQAALAENASKRLHSQIALIAEATAVCGSPDAGSILSKIVKERLNGTPWAVAEPVAKDLRAQFSAAGLGVDLTTVTKAVLRGMDQRARESKKIWSADLVAELVRQRWMVDCIAPVGPDVLATLDAVIAAHAHETANEIWSARSFAIDPDAPAHKVRIGVWDTAFDLSLFAAPPNLSFVILEDGTLKTGVTSPASDSKTEQMIEWSQGSIGYEAGLSTPQAEAYAAHIKTLDAKEIKKFSEQLNSIRSDMHGTAVASVVIEGNPFAEIVAVEDNNIKMERPRRSDIEGRAA